jgi:hypothetical protein
VGSSIRGIMYESSVQRSNRVSFQHLRVHLFKAHSFRSKKKVYVDNVRVVKYQSLVIV